jgi:ABC-type Fe3+-hydroxamate transport system substrate-binding protein
LRYFYGMPSFTDQTGHTINVVSAPRRVISLVPSQSEFLWDLGLQGELVGITKFCIHPHQMFAKVERVGGTKTPDIEKIRKLKPDLVIANKEENEQEQIRELRKEFNVWTSDIYTIKDAMEMMNTLGVLLNKEQLAADITSQIADSLQNIKGCFNGASVAYFMWHDPTMCAGSRTFIGDVLKHAGLVNVMGASRYPEITIDELKIQKPQYCFLSSEPFPFKEKHLAEIRELIPDAKVVLVDGEMFSWYGTRMLGLAEYIGHLKLQLEGNK